MYSDDTVEGPLLTDGASLSLTRGRALLLPASTSDYVLVSLYALVKPDMIVFDLFAHALLFRKHMSVPPPE